MSAFALFTALSIFIAPAHAQRKERQGKDVVDAVCGACHLPGKDNAPRIGDAKAWSARASQGLTALTDHAVKGIRNMPAHGGNAGVSDIEIERAITYMINQSGRALGRAGGRRDAGGGAHQRIDRPGAMRDVPRVRAGRRAEDRRPRGLDPEAANAGSTRWWLRPCTDTGRCPRAADCPT